MNDEWENSLMGKEDNESVLELLEIISFEVNNFIDFKKEKMTTIQLTHTVNSALISALGNLITNTVREQTERQSRDLIIYEFSILLGNLLRYVKERSYR
jgi:hypothetical protein